MPAFIDVHHHALPRLYVEAVGEHAITAQAPRYSRVSLNWTAERSIAEMDQHGVAAAVLSMSAPGLWFGDQAFTTRLARDCNHELAATVRRWPSRFGFFAALPLPGVDAALEEIRHAYDTLGADGIGLMSTYGDMHLGDAAFAPVMQELDRRRAVVFVHPTVPDACKPLATEFPASILEFPADTTRTVLSLLYSGTLARCPNIRFIFSHAGGATPFLAHRLARLEQDEERARMVPGGALALLQRQFYDVALSANPPALAALTTFVPSTQILFGSDYPFAPNMTARTLAGLAEHNFSAEDRARIEHANAAPLFPRLMAARG